MSSRLKLNEHFIEIIVDDAKSLELIGNIPYVHRNRSNTIFHTSIRNIDLVLKLFRDLDASNIHKAPEKVRYLYEMEMRRRSDTESLIMNGPVGSGKDTNAKLELMPHQQLGRELAQVNNRWAFFYDTRTGKTPLSLQIIWDDIQANPHHKWLVLCPLILIENAWMPDARNMFPKLSVVSLHHKLKDKRIALFNQKANVYLMNIESFIDYRPYIDKLGFYGAVLDESSAMKSKSSKFGKEAVDFAQTVKRWYILSGSPAPNGEWEYYRQLQSVDYYSVQASFNQFKLYFFDNMSRNPQYEKLAIKSDRSDELLALVRKYSLYVDKEDVLTTPGRDFYEVEVIMPKDIRSNYDLLKQELYLELGDSVTITAPSTAASLNKLNQVTSGFVIDTVAMRHNKMLREAGIKEGFKQEDYFMSDYRFEALNKLIEKEVGNEQAIIWCYYNKEFEIMADRLGSRAACIYSAVNITDKNKNIADFMAGRIQFLIAHPASLGKGVTLTNAHITIYFSLGYSYEHWKQSIDRIYGDVRKQPKRCKYYILIAPGTVDRTIYTTVQKKGDMSMAVLDHLKGGL